MRVKEGDEATRKLMQTRRESTERKRALFELNHPHLSLITMRECDYRRLLRIDPELKKFHDEWDGTFRGGGKDGKLNNSEMLEAIREGKLFGIGVASVAVPLTWEGSGFQHPLSPMEFFQAFPPLFQTTLVGYEDVGEYTQSVIRENQLTEKAGKLVTSRIARSREKGVPLDLESLGRDVCRIKFRPPPPQRLLVSVMKSNRLVCSSDLLQWYDSHGLQINLEHFIEYKPVTCFSPFVRKVTEARQKGNDVQSKGMKVCDIFGGFYSVYFFVCSVVYLFVYLLFS